MLLHKKPLFMKVKLFPVFASLFVSIGGMTQPDPEKLKGPYLGQKLPGIIPERFATGIISTKYYEHSAPAFSPDGKSVLWTILYPAPRPAVMMEMKLENGFWTAPKAASFEDSTADDFYPSFSGDGKKLYFSSRRRAPVGYPQVNGIRLWEVEKTNKGWSAPQLVDTTTFRPELYNHSITNSGLIYGSRRGAGGGMFDIDVYRKTSNGFQPPVTLPYNINSRWYEDGPFIAPDESFLIFESDRPGGIEGSVDLYISFRINNSWTPARNMGPGVNSKYTERFARLSPDGKYLFFGSDRKEGNEEQNTNIYWVDAKVIAVLKKQSLKEKFFDLATYGLGVLPAYYANDHSTVSRLLKDWLKIKPEDPTAYMDLITALRKSQQFAEAEKWIGEKPAIVESTVLFQLEKALIQYGLGNDENAQQIIMGISAEPAERNRFTRLAAELHSSQKYKESAALYEAALKITPQAVDFYNMACAYSLAGNKDKAFESLNKAADNGYSAKGNFERDTDLARLKTDERWSILMQKLDAPFNGRTPFKRAHHEMVYDESTKAVLLVGGSTPLGGGQSFKFFNDIWRFTESGWSKLGEAGDERSGIRMAYDTKRGKLYSFGGFTGNNQSSGQLRVLENGKWTVLTDIPEMKTTESGFVYDIARDKFITFGGSGGRGIVSNDLWEWDGNSWQKFGGTQPPSRQGFVMIYDSKRNKTVLFGGMDADGKKFEDGVWEFDGKEWKNIAAPNGPGPRMSPGYAFDSNRGLLIIFGGAGNNIIHNDTWGWDGIAWKKLAETGPPGRMMGYMAYDKGRDRVVMFGGRFGWPNDADDTWEWDGVKWQSSGR